MARTLGCVCLVTDDIKIYGPHYTLMRGVDSEVMPLKFYELLFLEYLEGIIDEMEVLNKFKTICIESDMKLNCTSKLKDFIRRFGHGKYKDSDKEWLTLFCNEKKVNKKVQLKKLSDYLVSTDK